MTTLGFPVLLAGLLCGVLLLAGCGGSSELEEGAEPDTSASAAPETFDVEGRLSLSSEGFEYDGPQCFGWKGYDDINAGTQVVIRDADGTSVGLGELGLGVRQGEAGSRVCNFRFTVSDIPSTGGLFSVEVGSRGQVSFPEAEAGEVALSLG